MKKLNKLFAVLVALAMMATLTVLSAFAVNDANEVNTAGTKAVKVLTMPKGVVPTGSIAIKATLDSIDGVDPATLEDNTGKIGNKVINLAPDANTGNFVKVENKDATDVYYYETDSVLLANDYHGGVYKYTISEDVTDWTVPNGATKKADDKTYEMTVNVGADNKVKQVFVGTDENKRDLFEDVDETNYNAAATDGTVFKNSVSQTLSGTSYDDTALGIKKTVIATDGIADTTTGFEIQFQITLPDTEGATTATYVVGETEKTVPSGTYTEKLADGKTIYFKSIPVGTKVVAITETDARANGTGATYTKDETGVTVGNITDKEHKLGGEIKNTRNKTELTGILMSNLPYIVLALVAIGGMVAYVVVRRRNADEA